MFFPQVQCGSCDPPAVGRHSNCPLSATGRINSPAAVYTGYIRHPRKLRFFPRHWLTLIGWHIIKKIILFVWNRRPKKRPPVSQQAISLSCSSQSFIYSLASQQDISSEYSATTEGFFIRSSPRHSIESQACRWAAHPSAVAPFPLFVSCDIGHLTPNCQQ